MAPPLSSGKWFFCGLASPPAPASGSVLVHLPILIPTSPLSCTLPSVLPPDPACPLMPPPLGSVLALGSCLPPPTCVNKTPHLNKCYGALAEPQALAGIYVNSTVSMTHHNAWPDSRTMGGQTLPPFREVPVIFIIYAVFPFFCSFWYLISKMSIINNISPRKDYTIKISHP